eukprot:TRINITY_DN10447_c0_g1_i1.p1 TRINITY_DN10447_c0_g1~~TRINITY_DN10447_c0_g1_i1.p1  ORF type:complete len:206 (-),score=88.39 TRINITY_DN10447_c0_g1_i1:75-692(-)
MLQKQAAQMRQQQAMMQSAHTGTLLDSGATVPEGPLAEEQVALVKLLEEQKVVAMNKAAKSVMTSKQIKLIERAYVKAKTESDMMKRNAILQKAQSEVYRQLSQDQQHRIQEASQAEMQRVNDAILAPQENTWISNLTDEQRQVWENTQKVAAGAEPIQRAQLTRNCLLYTSDAADDLLCVDLGGRRIIKKKKKIRTTTKSDKRE